MARRIYILAAYTCMAVLTVFIWSNLRPRKSYQEATALGHAPNISNQVPPFKGNNTSKQKLLLLTSARSGSSYTGYLFASNPDVFYMYEPLSVYNPKDDGFVEQEVLQSSIQKGYLCINSSVSCRLDYLYSCQLFQYFKEALFRLPNKSQMIKSWYGRIFAELQRNLHIEAIDAGLDALCARQFRIIAAKTIRLSYIEDVIPLIEKGLKVIYLIRDPRGIVSSRIPLGFISTGEKFIPQVKAECSKYSANINFLLKVKTSTKLAGIIQRNVIIVRYEDIIQDLYTMAKNIYRLLKLQMPKEVEEFAKSNAKVGLWGKPNMAKNQSNFKENEQLQGWRKKLNFTRVLQIQTVCQYAMETFGYNMIHRESDLKDLSYSVIGNVSRDLPCYVGL